MSRKLHLISKIGSCLLLHSITSGIKAGTSHGEDASLPELCFFSGSLKLFTARDKMDAKFNNTKLLRQPSVDH